MAAIPGDGPSRAPWTIVIDEIEVRGAAPSMTAIARAVERSVDGEAGSALPAAIRIAVARGVAATVRSATVRSATVRSATVRSATVSPAVAAAGRPAQPHAPRRAES
jgi:hypothetical protein